MRRQPMMPAPRALAIYHDYQKGKTTPTILANRYHTKFETVVLIITAQHRHTRNLPPIYTPTPRPKT